MIELCFKIQIRMGLSAFLRNNLTIVGDLRMMRHGPWCEYEAVPSSCSARGRISQPRSGIEALFGEIASVASNVANNLRRLATTP